MTRSSALVNTRPCLFSATHWYMPMSARFRLLIVSTPLFTWSLSCWRESSTDVSIPESRRFALGRPDITQQTVSDKATSQQKPIWALVVANWLWLTASMTAEYVIRVVPRQHLPLSCSFTRQPSAGGSLHRSLVLLQCVFLCKRVFVCNCCLFKALHSRVEHTI